MLKDFFVKICKTYINAKQNKNTNNGGNMTLLYVVLGIVVVVLSLILIIPVKVRVNFSMQSENKKNKEDLNTINRVDIYILRFVKIKTIDSKKKDRTNENTKNNNNKISVIDDISKAVENYIKYEKKDSLIISKKDIIKLKKGLKFQEFYLNLGFNLKEPLLNAYVLVLLNAILNMYIAKNSNHFNLVKTKYKTYISNNIIDFKFYSIINFKLVNNIIIIFKIIISLRKVVNKNGKTTSY